jgi:hypothetical protein
MAFTAVESTRIGLELATAIVQSCPATRQVFTDASTTYAANLVDYKAIVDDVTDALFNETAPTISP